MRCSENLLIRTLALGTLTDDELVDTGLTDDEFITAGLSTETGASDTILLPDVLIERPLPVLKLDTLDASLLIVVRTLLVLGAVTLEAVSAFFENKLSLQDRCIF